MQTAARISTPTVMPAIITDGTRISTMTLPSLGITPSRLVNGTVACTSW
jgi:hypothetical protein